MHQVDIVYVSTSNHMAGSSLHGHYHSKYAVPVSVIEYRNNIIAPAYTHNNKEKDKMGSSSMLYEINEHVYSTKPFLLKPNQQIAVYQLCIFKHDINIFNSKYEHDYHQIVMRCCCELVSIEYSGMGEGRVVGTFQGIIRGAGVNDALLIDFYDGIAVQVKGTLHTCVYQFEYIYTGGPIKKYITTNSNIHNNTVYNNKNRSSKQEKAKIFNNKYYNKVQQNSRQQNNNSNNNNMDKYNNNIKQQSVIITNMTFDMYCEMQSKQYVQSLLQYLLNQVKKSEQKVNINLQIFQTIKQSQLYNNNNIYASIYDNNSNMNNIDKYNNNKQQVTPNININIRRQASKSLQQQEVGNLKILCNLQQSIRSQSGIDKNEAINPLNKERLSIIRQQHNDNNNSNNNSDDNNNNDSVQIQLDEQDKYECSNYNMDDVINSININKMNNNTNINNTNNNTNINVDNSNIIVDNNNNKIQQIQDDDYIILDEQQPQQYAIQQANHNIIANNTHNIVNKQQQNNIYNNNIKQQSQSQVKRKRKKIFVQSSNPNSIPATNININHIPKTDNKIYNKIDNKIVDNNNKTKQLNIQLQIQQLQFTNKQSFYGDRSIPVSNTQMHPNHTAINQHTHTNQYNSKSNIKQNIKYDNNNNNNSNKISKVTIQQFQQILHSNCLSIYEKWRKFINYLTKPQATLLLTAYHNDYHNKLLSLLNQSIVRFKGSFDIDIYSKQQSQRNKMAAQIRQQTIENQKNVMINQFRFYDKSLFCKTKPVMFEQSFVRASHEHDNTQNESKNNKKFIKVSLTHNASHNANNMVIKHLIILVHGLGACRLDMDKIKLELRRYYKQKVHVVSSSANQGRTEGDINMMGVRLAHQADQQIAKFHGNLEDNECMKVSFFGHSMGGVIIRSALPRLQKYKKYFHSFVTLSSPHVGYTYSSSKLVDVGLWLINNWRKCESILQLTMSDQNNTNARNKNTNNMENTFLYKLSQQRGLEWFKKITFLASRQDLYVPYFSARVQKHEQCLNDLKAKSQYAVLHSKMIDNILSRITGSVTRIDVNFCITEQSVDNLIGRTAHIHFVNNTEFVRLLIAADQTTII